MPDTGTSRILTLVFTDLADSTALKTQRGDRAVGELISRHRALVRRLAEAFGGRIIDWAGDGCFLTFEAPSAAVLFSLRLQQAHREETDLPGLRIGMHLGEVSERAGPEGDLAHPRVEGLAVDFAARICGLARPAQVLMSSPVAASAGLSELMLGRRGPRDEFVSGLMASARRAVELDSRDPAAHLGLAAAYLALGDPNTGRRAVSRKASIPLDGWSRRDPAISRAMPTSP